jgi:hypothetical protein
MTFKPMTYLISFTLFVVVFMGLGGYVGYQKLADHYLVQGYLEAVPINAQLQTDRQGQLLHWDDQVPLQQGLVARIDACNRSRPITIQYSNGSGAVMPAPSPLTGIALGPDERTEDVRVDRSGHYLYARVFTPSGIKAKEATWLYKYDLLGRGVSRRTSVNPILLPAPFRP